MATIKIIGAKHKRGSGARKPNPCGAHGAGVNAMAKRSRAKRRKGKRNPSGLESTLPAGMRAEVAKKERLALIKQRAAVKEAADKKAFDAMAKKLDADVKKARAQAKAEKAKAKRQIKAVKVKAAKTVKAAKKVAKVRRAPKKSAPAKTVSQPKEPTMAKRRARKARKARKGTRTAAQKRATKRMLAANRKTTAKVAAPKRRRRRVAKRAVVHAAPKAPRKGKRRGRRAGPAVTATVTGTIGKKKRHTYVGSGRVRTYLVNPVGTTGRLVLAVIMVPLGYLGVTAMSRALATRSSLSGATDSSGNAVALNGANAFRSFGRPDGTVVGAAAAATAGLGILTALVHKKHPLVTAILGGLAVGSGVKFAALGGEFIAHKLQLTAPSDSTVLMNRLFPEVYAGTAFADPLTPTTYTTQQGLPPARRQMFAGPVGAVAGVTNRPRSGAVGALRPVALRPVQSAKSISSQPKDERDELFDKVCAEVGAQSAK